MLTHTHTYAVLCVKDSTYKDVRRRLLAAGDYGEMIHDDGDNEVIAMQGVALQAESEQVEVERRRELERTARRKASEKRGDLSIDMVEEMDAYNNYFKEYVGMGYGPLEAARYARLSVSSLSKLDTRIDNDD